MTQEGVVFDIQRHCVHDGPGIRTVIFLKGCTLRCPWCANPESHRFEPELFFDPRRCIGCGQCIEVCPHGAISESKGRMVFDRALCQNCCSCCQVCYSGARSVKGERLTADDVIQEAIKDEVFYLNSGGGITLGGGEPLTQDDFSAAILHGCRIKGLHTAVETAGCVGWASISKVIPHTNLFLYDLKHLDPEAHERWVGAPNKTILSNLDKLTKTGKAIIVRVPIIPGFNDEIDTVKAIASHVAGLGVRELHLLPYHPYGNGKYRLLGRECPFSGKQTPARSRLEQLEKAADSWGLKVLIGG